MIKEEFEGLVENKDWKWFHDNTDEITKALKKLPFLWQELDIDDDTEGGENMIITIRKMLSDLVDYLDEIKPATSSYSYQGGFQDPVDDY